MNTAQPVRSALGGVLVLAGFLAMVAWGPPWARSSAPGDLVGQGANPVLVCEQACSQGADQELALENARHRAVIADCEEDPDCLREADLLHQAILEEIEEDHQACWEECQPGLEAGSDR